MLTIGIELMELFEIFAFGQRNVLVSIHYFFVNGGKLAIEFLLTFFELPTSGQLIAGMGEQLHSLFFIVIIASTMRDVLFFQKRDMLNRISIQFVEKLKVGFEFRSQRKQKRIFLNMRVCGRRK